MSDIVSHPAHYTGHPSGVECIEVVRYLPACWANLIKYLWRAELKNGGEDLAKAGQYASWIDALSIRLVNDLPAAAFPFTQIELVRNNERRPLEENFTPLFGALSALLSARFGRPKDANAWLSALIAFLPDSLVKDHRSGRTP